MVWGRDKRGEGKEKMKTHKLGFIDNEGKEEKRRR
jgi:hypothetical protein